MYNDPKSFNEELKYQVYTMLGKKEQKAKRGISGLIKERKDGYSICSQCKLGMKKPMADEQLKNKRENAPICMACIMGIPRKPKFTPNQERSQWREETKKIANIPYSKK